MGIRLGRTRSLAQRAPAADAAIDFKRAKLTAVQVTTMSRSVKLCILVIPSEG